MGVYDKQSVRTQLKWTKQVNAAQNQKDNDRKLTKQEQMILGDRASYSVSCTDFIGNLAQLLTEDEAVKQFIANMILTSGKNKISLFCGPDRIVHYRPKMVSWKEVGLTEKQIMELYKNKKARKTFVDYENADGEAKKYVDYLVKCTAWLFDKTNHRSIIIMRKIKNGLYKALTEINNKEE